MVDNGDNGRKKIAVLESWRENVSETLKSINSKIDKLLETQIETRVCLGSVKTQQRFQWFLLGGIAAYIISNFFR